jgi:multidrug efflux system outer membrane protein|tara:strand:- start:3559 stop:4965 length:1407 start_codon:yes stop_codon:yes gene_type:complete
MNTVFTLSKKIKLMLSTAVLTTVLSGCATGINEQQYQQKLQTFIEEAEIAPTLVGEDEINWWQQFNSSQLNQLVDDALAMNHDLKTSQLQLESAIARLGGQKAQYLPQGGIEVNSNRNSLGDTINSQSSANLAMDWQLDLFGRITALVDAAAASTMSQAEQLRLLKIEVISSVVSGFVSYQGNKQKQRIISQQVEALQQSIEVLVARVEEGGANELDLNRTRAQLSQQQSILPEIEYQLYRDLSTLAILTGRLANDINVESEQALVDMPLNVTLNEPSTAIALRPDISRALYEFSQAYSLSIAASKALLPDISLTGFTGILSLGNNRLSDTQQQWQIAPQINWSLLSYPALLAQRDAQQILSEAAYSDYQQVVLNAISESELSLQLLIKESDQQRYAKDRYLHANNAFSQAEAMYEEGQIPYLELLDARQDVLMAEENAVDSAISSLIAKISIYHAFNGRWSYALTSL